MTLEPSGDKFSFGHLPGHHNFKCPLAESHLRKVVCGVTKVLVVQSV